ncbi:MAG: hypothetical protein ACRD4L_08050 [Pyrinomonadaceae bacterium]
MLSTKRKSGTGGAGPITSIVEAIVQQLRQQMWLPSIYEHKIRHLRTRAYSLDIHPPVKSVEIQHTLLGIELKADKRRIACPDLATARYLAVFARIGCTEIAVPYDITRISVLADELESAWQKMILLVEHNTTDKTIQARSRVKSRLVKAIRQSINEIGSGNKVPTFNQNHRCPK